MGIQHQLPRIRWVLVLILAIVVLALHLPARAQQSPEDGRIAIYRQLLAASNDNVAALGAQLQAAQIENAQMKAQIGKLKPEPPKDVQSDGRPMLSPMPLAKP